MRSRRSGAYGLDLLQGLASAGSNARVPRALLGRARVQARGLLSVSVSAAAEGGRIRDQLCQLLKSAHTSRFVSRSWSRPSCCL